VRWEHEEDIIDCRDCGAVFSDPKIQKVLHFIIWETSYVLKGHQKSKNKFA